MKLNNSVRLIIPLVVMTAWIPCGCSYREEASLKAADLIDKGWEYYRQHEFNLAIKDFEAARNLLPTNSNLYLSATYNLAVAWDMSSPGKRSEQAKTFYQQMVHLSPQSNLAAWSLLALARMGHLAPVGEDPDYDALHKAYQEVIDRFPNHPAGEEALLYQQAASLASLDKQKAEQVLQILAQFIKGHPDSKYISAAYDLMAVSCQILDQPEDQVKMLIKAGQTREQNPVGPKVSLSDYYWKIATVCEFEVGDFETARIFYRKLTNEYPTDWRLLLTRLELQRMDDVEAEIRNGLTKDSTRSGKHD